MIQVDRCVNIEQQKKSNYRTHMLLGSTVKIHDSIVSRNRNAK